MIRALVATSIALSIAASVIGCASAPPRSPLRAQTTPPASGVAAGGSSTSQQPSVPAVLPPRAADLIPVVKELARLNSDNLVISRVEDIKTAKDSAGTWWVSARVTAESRTPALGRIYLMAEGGRWVVRYFGSNVDEAGLPADVRDGL